MKDSFAEIGLERVLASLQRDLLAASDQEILEVAHEIGLQPGMRGSVALFGVTLAVDVSRLKARMARRSAEKRGAPRPRGGAKDDPPN
jgi:hypothetical protein